MRILVFLAATAIWGGRLGELPEVRYRTSFIVKSAQREVEVDWSHARQVLDTKFSWHGPTGSGVGKTIFLLTKICWHLSWNPQPKQTQHIQAKEPFD